MRGAGEPAGVRAQYIVIRGAAPPFAGGRRAVYSKAMAESMFLEQLATHERRLANGLTVIVREDHSAPVVAVVTHVKAGYFDEPDRVVGISHVLEHMFFKGTARRGVGEIARETKAAGGYLNAGTIYDYTSYYTVLPSASLEQALDIQSDALQNSAIDEDELRRELLVIIQEANRKLDNPNAIAQETLFATMFDEHRIRRWRIGAEDVLRGFTRDDVWGFYRNHYRASRVILVVAGDVDADRVFAIAEKSYGAMPGGEPERADGPAEPARREVRVRELEGDIAQTHVEWGWHTPGSLHADTPALDMLAVALGQGRASRLYRHVRDAGAVAAISAHNYTPTQIGIFGISAELDPADTRDAIARTAAVIDDIRAHGFTDAEAGRARNIVEARVLRRVETAEGQANLIAAWQALGDWRLAGEYMQSLMNIGAKELHDAALTYLDPEALTLVAYRPRSAQPLNLDAASIRATTPLPPHSVVVNAAPARSREPAGVQLQRVEDGVHFYGTTDGRGNIVVKPRRTAPLVSLAIYARGGIHSETADNAGITGLMARTSVKGTKNRTAVQLAEETEALGGSISPGAGIDLVDWSLSVPARHFSAALELLLDAALEPAFDAEQAERERKMMLSDLEHLRDDMHQYPLRLAMSSAFPGHPYGFDVAQLERAVRGMDVTRLGDWHRARVLRAAPTVFAVGDIDDPDAAAATIASMLNGRLDEPVQWQPPVPQWPLAGTQRVEQRDKAQTALAIAFPGPTRNDPDVHALQVLSAAIAGLGGRLFEELRSRMSLAYTVSAAPMPRWLGGAFVAYIGMAPAREGEARAALLRELARTTTEPLSPQEIANAKRYLIGTHQIRQQTHGRQLLDIAYALLLGDGLDELRTYESSIEQIDAERVRAAAARWITPERAVEGIVRGK